jgi:hypothetical protein
MSLEKSEDGDDFSIQRDILRSAVNRENVKETYERVKKELIKLLKNLDIQNYKEIEAFYLTASLYTHTISFLLAEEKLSKGKKENFDDALSSIGATEIQEFVTKDLRDNFSEEEALKIMAIDAKYEPTKEDWSRIHSFILASSETLLLDMPITNQNIDQKYALYNRLLNYELRKFDSTNPQSIKDIDSLIESYTVAVRYLLAKEKKSGGYETQRSLEAVAKEITLEEIQGRMSQDMEHFTFNSLLNTQIIHPQDSDFILLKPASKVIEYIQSKNQLMESLESLNTKNEDSITQLYPKIAQYIASVEKRVTAAKPTSHSEGEVVDQLAVINKIQADLGNLPLSILLNIKKIHEHSFSAPITIREDSDNIFFKASIITIQEKALQSVIDSLYTRLDGMQPESNSLSSKLFSYQIKSCKILITIATLIRLKNPGAELEQEKERLEMYSKNFHFKTPVGFQSVFEASNQSVVIEELTKLKKDFSISDYIVQAIDMVKSWLTGKEPKFKTINEIEQQFSEHTSPPIAQQ